MTNQAPMHTASHEFTDQDICNLYYKHLGSPDTKNTHMLLVATKNPTPNDFETDFKLWYSGFTCAAREWKPDIDIPTFQHVVHLIAENAERGRKSIAA